MTAPEDKWRRLLELEAKPVPLEAQLLDEAAKLLADELRGPFPPETGGFEHGTDAQKFQPLLDEPRTRPDEAAFRAGFHLARLDLSRELEAYEAHLRALAPSQKDKLAMLFLSRWLSEQLLELKDRLRTPLSRAKLCEILERAERRLLGPRH